MYDIYMYDNFRHWRTWGNHLWWNCHPPYRDQRMSLLLLLIKNVSDLLLHIIKLVVLINKISSFIMMPENEDDNSFFLSLILRIHTTKFPTIYRYNVNCYIYLPTKSNSSREFPTLNLLIYFLKIKHKVFVICIQRIASLSHCCDLDK